MTSRPIQRGLASRGWAGDKGLLAMDESNPTCNHRFAALGIPQTEEARRAWRELIVTTPDLADSISDAILYDETIRQRLHDGRPFPQALADAGIVVGIKVDAGTNSVAFHFLRIAQHDVFRAMCCASNALARRHPPTC